MDRPEPRRRAYHIVSGTARLTGDLENTVNETIHKKDPQRILLIYYSIYLNSFSGRKYLS